MNRPLILLGVLLLLANPVLARDRFYHFGPRAAAMGGAFTAVADDATAFYWNPAGYAFGPFLRAGFQWGEAEMDRNDLVDRLSARDGGGELFLERGAGFSFGFTFMGVAGTFEKRTTSVRTGGRVESRALDTFDLAVSILQSLPLENLVVAANLHYLQGEAYEASSPAGELASSRAPRDLIFERARDVEGVSSRTGALDLALLYEPRDPGFLRFGLMWRRLVEPSFRLGSGGEIVLPRHARAGVAVSLPRNMLAAVDVDLSEQGTARAGGGGRELSLGLSKGFVEEALSVRAGLRAELGSDASRPAFSIGAGGRLSFLLFDLAYLGASGGRDRSLWFGVTVAR